ncbi:Protein of unknown function [Halorientalis persicus]|uniref:DUF3311 domain-containing protein n=2 Tax=Halorientalis persicus TaxID=1367881 RepID=A0A1H8D044_9EURY|nr:DUF3311 domain-containing protein [Halorientalis persicus]SEN00703.1 Protein of unknown function [Halorientalis persicus]
MTSTTMDRETYAWAAVAVLLVALAIPWFWWGSSRVVAGLPVWVWWHVGWLGLTAVVFAAFARWGWGLGIEPAGGDSDG